MSRIGDLPVLQQREVTVDAKLYNLWRRAKLHFSMPMRLEFEELPGVVMILDVNEWACVDARQNDFPILAWVEFSDQGRDSLHTPVACKLNFYHYAASMHRSKVLKLMAESLEQYLHDED